MIYRLAAMRFCDKTAGRAMLAPTFLLGNCTTNPKLLSSCYEMRMLLRMALMAPFSSRETWAWEMPRAPATSIWVLPS